MPLFELTRLIVELSTTGFWDPFIDIATAILYAICVIVWQLDRTLLLLAWVLLVARHGMVLWVFSPGLESLSLSMTEGIGAAPSLLALFFSLAVFLLGITYVLAAFWFKELNLVDWKKALAWLLGALFFYSAGVGIYQGGETLRELLATLMYTKVLRADETASGRPAAVQALYDNVFSAISFNTDIAGMAKIVNWQWDDQDKALDGIDITLSYLLADSDDLLTSTGWEFPIYGNEPGYVDYELACPLDVTPPNPDSRGFYAVFFQENKSRCTWYRTENCTQCSASEQLDLAAQAINRAGMALFLGILSIIEQFIHLLLSLGAAFVFFTLAFALLLSFFNATEHIAKALLKIWLDLIIMSLYASFLLGVAMLLVLASADTGNPFLTLSLGLIAIVMSAYVSVEVAKAVLNAIKSVPTIGAMAASSVTGSGTVLKGAAVAGGAIAAGAAVGIATGGAGTLAGVAGGAAKGSAMAALKGGIATGAKWGLKGALRGGRAAASGMTQGPRAGLSSLLSPSSSYRQVGSRQMLQASDMGKSKSSRSKLGPAFGSSSPGLKPSAGSKTTSGKALAGAKRQPPKSLPPTPKRKPPVTTSAKLGAKDAKNPSPPTTKPRSQSSPPPAAPTRTRQRSQSLPPRPSPGLGRASVTKKPPTKPGAGD